jgi:hypothetical protein
MKKTLLSLLALVITLTSTTLLAQDELTSGHVTMEITKIESDDEAMAAQLQMLKGTTTDIYFAPEQYMSVMSMMGGLMNITNKVGVENGKMDMYMDMMGQKMWIETTTDESAEGKPTTADVDITYDKADTKEIQGYKCYLMTIKSADMQGGSVKAYITQDIKSDAKFIQGYEKVEYEGFPLEVTLSMPVMSMTMETTSIKNELPAGSFDVNTDGYEKMSMEEFTEKMGGMGAGLGF